MLPRPPIRVTTALVRCPRIPVRGGSYYGPQVELGGKVKRMSTCITDVIEFVILVACGYSQCVCRLPSNCGPTIIAPGVKICVLWGPLWPSGYATGICCLRWPICSLREDLHVVCFDPSMGWYAEVDALCHLA